MPRRARLQGRLGFYHVMVRGNGKQILFEDEADHEHYLHKLYFCFKEEGVVLLAWCLMDNHAHLLIRDESGSLPTAMARLNGSFATYYNDKYGHVGHVFQDRYRCEPIESQRYLLEVVRYIHNNPEDAGVCRTEDYRWSSYSEYMGSPRYANTNLILGLLGSRANFKAFCHEKTDASLRLRFTNDLSTEALLEIAKEVTGSVDPTMVAALPRKERDSCLSRLRNVGFSLRQIERLTGIAKGTIQYATRELDKNELPDDFVH